MVGWLRNFSATFVFLSTTALCIYACSIDLNLRRSEDAGPPGPSCLHAVPPDRPAPVGGSTGDVAIKVAIRSVEIGTENEPVGFDLDNLCTCPDQPSCQAPTGSNTCDRSDAGQDNASAEIFRALALQYDPIRQVNEGLAEGVARGILVYVDGYNGKPDDDSVAISILTSTGVVKAPPTFTAADEWKVDVSSLAFPDKNSVLIGNLVAPTAYVRDNTLVAYFERDFPLALDESFTLTLNPALITAKVVRDNNGAPTLSELTLAGHWSGDNILRAVRGAKVLGKKDGGPICQDRTAASVVALISSIVCQNMDLPTQGASNQSPCRVASFGLRAKLSPASFGSLREPSNVLGYPCEDAGLVCP